MGNLRVLPSPGTPLCHCGRALRHTGRHWDAASTPKPLPKPTGRAKLRLLLDQEIKASHATILKLKGEISTRQIALLEVEGQLGPLVKLLEAYRDLALPAPKTVPPDAPAAPIVKPWAVERKEVRPFKAPVYRAPPEGAGVVDQAAEADYEPIEANFGQVLQWASARGVQFRSWEDLPQVNHRREDCEQPPYKRPLRGMPA